MNIYDIKSPKSGEIFQELYKNRDILIETIYSSDKLEDKIYNQSWDEWIVLLEGEAVLEIEKDIKRLKKGDTLLIKADTAHKVIETKGGTVWLCVHIGVKSE